MARTPSPCGSGSWARRFIINARNSNTAGYNLPLASNFGDAPVGACSVTPEDRSSPVAPTGAGCQLLGEEPELWRPGLRLPGLHRRSACVDGVGPGSLGAVEGRRSLGDRLDG